MARTSPPRPPAAPPASIAEGAARVTDYAVKLYDRQDGQGVNWLLLTNTLFRAAFDLLDKLPDDQRQAVALRVQERVYPCTLRGPLGVDSGSSIRGPVGAVLAPSNTDDLKSKGPRPPR